MLPIFSILLIVDLAYMTAEINTTKTTILTIAIITTIMAVSHGEESVIFLIKKVVALVSIQMMNNGKLKNFGDETKNSVEIKINITHFWLIMKEIRMMR